MVLSPLALLGFLVSPAALLGNFSYLLQLSSVLMRNIAWLRALAILAGMSKIVYRLFFVSDPVSAVWEAVFTAVNLGQLALIWWENRPPRFNPEERRFIETVAPGLPPADARALLRSGAWTDVPAGTRVTTEGERVNALIFISEGKVRIDLGGLAVGACGAGDFLGEMTYANGNAATATATSVEALRYLKFERHILEQAQARRPVLRMALQASLNRNLIEKLQRSNGAKSEPPRVASA